MHNFEVSEDDYSSDNHSDDETTRSEAETICETDAEPEVYVSEPDTNASQSKRGQRLGKKARRRQTLRERYKDGLVNPIITDQYTNMKSNKQKKAR